MRLPRCGACGWSYGEGHGPLLILVERGVPVRPPRVVCPRCEATDLRCPCGKPWRHPGGCAGVPFYRPPPGHPWKGRPKKPLDK